MAVLSGKWSLVTQIGLLSFLRPRLHQILQKRKITMLICFVHWLFKCFSLGCPGLIARGGDYNVGSDWVLVPQCSLSLHKVN